MTDANACPIRHIVMWDVAGSTEAEKRRAIDSDSRKWLKRQAGAFDRVLTAVPLKGQVLTQLARYWFEHTADICPNHVISYPDPNVVIGKRHGQPTTPEAAD